MPAQTLEEFVSEVFAECTHALVKGIELERRSGERKDLTREAIAIWTRRFDATVGKELREIGNLKDARRAWNSADEGRDYVLKQISKVARKAYTESGFGWSIDDEDVDEAVQHVIDRADKRFARKELDGVNVSNLKRWCE